ncbi:MAG: ChaN family lipoprotein [Paracoccaceae bacterium]
MRIPFVLPIMLLANIATADTAKMLEDFAFAGVIVLGEIHDNPQHHVLQAEITNHMQPSALVFEMFSTSQAEIINTSRWEGIDISALAETFEWHKSGWPAFENYARIIRASPESVIFGAATPIDDVRDAMFEGAATVFGVDAPFFGLDKPLPVEQQAAREAMQMQAHCNALPKGQLAGMVEAQRLRDAVLADTVVRALDEVGGPVIVITGNGHARDDWGLTAALDTLVPDLVVMSLGQFEALPEGAQPYTHISVSDPVDRDDPCLGLKG